MTRVNEIRARFCGLNRLTHRFEGANNRKCGDSFTDARCRPGDDESVHCHGMVWDAVDSNNAFSLVPGLFNVFGRAGSEFDGVKVNLH
ncbi:hypothetical protein GCM10009000_062780 [Halobacterium noricense]